MISCFTVLSSRLFSGFGKGFFSIAAIPLCNSRAGLCRVIRREGNFILTGLTASGVCGYIACVAGSEILGAISSTKAFASPACFFFVPLYSEGHVFYDFLSLETAEGA